jgi:hypothetical protein
MMITSGRVMQTRGYKLAHFYFSNLSHVSSDLPPGLPPPIQIPLRHHPHSLIPKRRNLLPTPSSNPSQFCTHRNTSSKSSSIVSLGMTFSILVRHRNTRISNRVSLKAVVLDVEMNARARAKREKMCFAVRVETEGMKCVEAREERNESWASMCCCCGDMVGLGVALEGRAALRCWDMVSNAEGGEGEAGFRN